VLPVKKVLSPVPFFDDSLLEVLRWVSERYVAPLASVIGRAVPPRVVSEEARWAGAWRGEVAEVPGGLRRAEVPGGLRRASPPPSPHLRPPGTSSVPSGLASGLFARYRDGDALTGSLAGGAPGTFVVRVAPEDEVGLAVEAVRGCLVGGRRAVVIVPEAAPVPATAAGVVAAFGERVGLFLGGDKRARYAMWLKILAGRYEVVVGTRPAVFAPVDDLGLVFVSRESHTSHREDRAPYYHVRDVAVARARSAGAVCVLSAICPSSEAAALDARRVEPLARAWPPVEVVRPGPEGRASRLIRALADARRGFIYAPLPGAGIAAVCRSCGSPAACAACGGVLRLEEGAVTCVVCGADGRCAVCGASSFGIRPGGAERVGAWASRAARVPVRRVTGGRARLPRGDEIVVGGADVVKDLGTGALDLVAILDADLAARRPGLGGREQSLTTWMEAVSWARPHGRVIVQSDQPGDPAIQAVVRGNPERFHRDEAARRRDAGFPVGSAVFRVIGTPALEGSLRELSPHTLLVSDAGEATVCLLALDARAVPAFGRLARELAAAQVLTRVEAEPHL
jgi:primosomal protein N' (replication factor Y) (superfamily II helicase)